MKPSIKHFTERRILQGIEICLNHFPEEVQEKEKKQSVISGI